MGTKQVCIMLGVYYSKEIGRGLTQSSQRAQGTEKRMGGTEKRRNGEKQDANNK